MLFFSYNFQFSSLQAEAEGNTRQNSKMKIDAAVDCARENGLDALTNGVESQHYQANCAWFFLSMADVTQMLRGIQSGDQKAAEEMLALVYSELKRIAAQKMASEAAGHTLQPTALVHEAWLSLVGGGDAHFENRAHFFASAAEAMRRILIDWARRKHAIKRGSGAAKEELKEEHWIENVRSDELLAVDEGLDLLAKEDPAAAQLIKLRYFVGMNMEEAASTMGVPIRSAERIWTYARAWLKRQISGQHSVRPKTQKDQ